jgi:UDP-2,3-diacylglucosamine hydrolase
MNIMDVTQDAVEKIMKEYEVDVLLHGHTHRPGVHVVDVDGRKGKRIVLGDWYTQGSVVRWTSRGASLEEMPR